MIIQQTLTRDELPLLKAMLPLWKKYADGFIFGLHDNRDNTREYLESVAQVFNILEIHDLNSPTDTLEMETDVRGFLFERAKSYSEYIICLDTDEYLDGKAPKEFLEAALSKNPDTVFLAKWIQYTGKNKIRVDGPWKDNFKDRIGSYRETKGFGFDSWKHSPHIPIPSIVKKIHPEDLFIAHLAWLDKTHAAIKQYYWKVEDYVVNHLYKAETYDTSAYDASINNLNWEEINFNFPLKVPVDIFSNYRPSDSYRLKEILEHTQKYNIPNLGDWGLGIHDNSLYVKLLLNEIKTLHGT